MKAQNKMQRTVTVDELAGHFYNVLADLKYKRGLFALEDLTNYTIAYKILFDEEFVNEAIARAKQALRI